MKGKRPTIFRNEQWDVTNSGLVSRMIHSPCRLQIDAELLLESRTIGDRRLYDWPLYIAQKWWVEPALFFEAFEVAIRAHEGRYPGCVDEERLQASFDEARRISALPTANGSRPAAHAEACPPGQILRAVKDRPGSQQGERHPFTTFEAHPQP